MKPLKPGSEHLCREGLTGLRRGLPLLLVLLALLGLVGAALAASAVTIDWQVIAAGGAPAEGSGILINDTLGQPVIGLSSGRDIDLSAGYWSGIPPQFNIFMPFIEM